jgi:hypothetical protein
MVWRWLVLVAALRGAGDHACSAWCDVHSMQEALCWLKLS